MKNNKLYTKNLQVVLFMAGRLISIEFAIQLFDLLQYMDDQKLELNLGLFISYYLDCVRGYSISADLERFLSRPL